jgi:hypothetical protein
MVWSKTIIRRYYPKGADQCPGSSNGEIESRMDMGTDYLCSFAKRNKQKSDSKSHNLIPPGPAYIAKRNRQHNCA